MTQLRSLSTRQDGRYLKTNVGAGENYKIVRPIHRISTAQSIQDLLHPDNKQGVPTKVLD